VAGTLGGAAGVTLAAGANGLPARACPPPTSALVMWLPLHPGRLCRGCAAGGAKAVALTQKAARGAVLVRHPDSVMLTDVLMALHDIGASGFNSRSLGRFVRTHVHGVASSDALSEDFVMI